MSECGCGNCTCSQGLQITTESASAAEEIQYESSGFETYEWKMPVIFPNTDGGINKNG
jgi:hypothetical protein